MPCKHADKMMIYAKQAAECDEPWKLWEWQDGECNWNRLSTNPVWSDQWEYRQIPKTIMINGHQVPEPMREKPDLHTPYYFVDARTPNGINEFIWKDDTWDNNIFNSIGCHLTHDNCIAHAKALISFTEEKE